MTTLPSGTALRRTRAARRARTLGALLVFAVATIAAVARAPRRATDEGMCAPSDDDTTGWRLVKTPAISLRVPPRFSEEHRRGTWTVLVAGQKQIGLGLGEGLDEIASGGTFELMDGCKTVIGGRSVDIRVLRFTVYDAPQAPSGNLGPKYIADARWVASNGLPTVSAFIFSNDKSDLRRYKGVFYTADVGVKPPPPCTPIKPMPAADSVVDSAAIAMRLQSDARQWPPGSAIMMLRFDSAGTLASMGVTSADLPDSTKRALAMLVGTNVRSRPAGVPSAVQVKVTSTASALGYEVVSANLCPP